MQQPINKTHKFNLCRLTNLPGGTILIYKANNKTRIFEVSDDFVDDCYYDSVPVERGSTRDLTAGYMTVLGRNREPIRVDKESCSYPTAKEYYNYKNLNLGI